MEETMGYQKHYWGNEHTCKGGTCQKWLYLLCKWGSILEEKNLAMKGTNYFPTEGILFSEEIGVQKTVANSLQRWWPNYSWAHIPLHHLKLAFSCVLKAGNSAAFDTFIFNFCFHQILLLKLKLYSAILIWKILKLFISGTDENLSPNIEILSGLSVTLILLCGKTLWLVHFPGNI